MADDKAQPQPKSAPVAANVPEPATPSTPAVSDTATSKKASTPATAGAAAGQVTRETTNLRCPACNRLSEWDDTFLAANHGERVSCPLCSETMALP